MFIQSSIFGQKPRARDIGIPFNGTTGKFNAITDVKGVEVGYSTLISGQGQNIRGKDPLEQALQPFCREAATTTLFLPIGIH